MLTTNETSVKDLTIQFAKLFTNKDADGIGTLLTDDFALFDPALKWIKGKKTVVDVLKKQFKETNNVSYEVVNAYEDGNMGILEFKITLDDLIMYGVDFMVWKNGKMSELRCYYNPPDPPKSTLKPFSLSAKSIVPGTIYQHYKRNRYKILSLSRHADTMEELVVYQALYGEKDIWVRPLNRFLENVIKEGKTVPRFVRIEEKI